MQTQPKMKAIPEHTMQPNALKQLAREAITKRRAKLEAGSGEAMVAG
jgi:hypothetical protein